MGVFDNMLHSDQTLFKNSEALDFAFIPKIMPYREEQQRRIAAAIEPLFNNRNGKNLVIHGMPGIGKTLACRKVLSELEEQTDEIVPIYINCWKKNTSYKVLIEICELIGYRLIQNKKTVDLFRDVVKLLNKKKVVFVFDEIDKAEDYDFIYTFLEEIYKKSIIMITNFKSFLGEMDERVKSRLVPELIEFMPYNAIETKGILKQRVESAFYPNVWETEAFEVVVAKTAAMQDIRTGMQLLKNAGDNAENRSSKKITLMHAKEAIDKNDAFSETRSTDLKDEDKTILNIIKKNNNSKIGDLYKHYNNAGGKSSYKTFQRKLNSLEKNGFVKLTKSKGEGGNTTIVEYKEREKRLTDYQTNNIGEV